ncbi:RHS repeat-associated core domain protein-containing protein [Pseudomonas sp. GM78]|uniref:RHS repeat-associated core domain-containing protein n=1 Tax=Pseudomonas sp. GM78 TaxID=1144337 RepID=UPI00026FB13E|nr:RHS repeat-associated core domain-containing protein [Pseudomonas sp. GM78]EJN31570.1 RHS repeat-associated core domain protein-containing protein [Pseudomonas sp. GM78]
MPISPRQNLLCRYRYDALDRSINWAPIGQAGIQRFHCNDHLATEIQGSVKHSIIQHDDHVLAQQQHMDDQVDITLLATDLQMTVLNALNAGRAQPIAYTPYGHRRHYNGLLSLLGFNGERPDPVTGHYHLGNGYRQFNPILMRFNSPDSLSPFGKGGLNAYTYCLGNPILNTDPTGHGLDKVIEVMNKKILKKTGFRMSPDTIEELNATVPHRTRLDGTSDSESVIHTLFNNSINKHYDDTLIENIEKTAAEHAAGFMPTVLQHQAKFIKRRTIIHDLTLGRANLPNDSINQMDNHLAGLNSAIEKLKQRANAYIQETASSYNNSLFPTIPTIPRASPTRASKNLRQPERK